MQGAQGTIGGTASFIPFTAGPLNVTLGIGTSVQYVARTEISTTFNNVAFAAARACTLTRLTVVVTSLTALLGGSVTASLYRDNSAPPGGTPTAVLSVSVTPGVGIYTVTGSVPIALGDRLALGFSITALVALTVNLVSQASIELN